MESPIFWPSNRLYMPGLHRLYMQVLAIMYRKIETTLLLRNHLRFVLTPKPLNLASEPTPSRCVHVQGRKEKWLHEQVRKACASEECPGCGIQCVEAQRMSLWPHPETRYPQTPKPLDPASEPPSRCVHVQGGKENSDCMNKRGRHAQVRSVLAAAPMCPSTTNVIMTPPRNPKISKERRIKVCACTSDEGTCTW